MQLLPQGPESLHEGSRWKLSIFAPCCHTEVTQKGAITSGGRQVVCFQSNAERVFILNLFTYASSERNLRSLVSARPFRWCFTRFHQDLGWLSCLRSPTFRHEVDHYVIRVSPDNWATLSSLLTSLSSVPPFFISNAHSCHRYLEPNDCSAPIPLASSAPSMTLLRKGLLAIETGYFCLFSRIWSVRFV